MDVEEFIQKEWLPSVEYAQQTLGLFSRLRKRLSLEPTLEHEHCLFQFEQDLNDLKQQQADLPAYQCLHQQLLAQHAAWQQQILVRLKHLYDQLHLAHITEFEKMSALGGFFKKKLPLAHDIGYIDAKLAVTNVLEQVLKTATKPCSQTKLLALFQPLLVIKEEREVRLTDWLCEMELAFKQCYSTFFEDVEATLICLESIALEDKEEQLVLLEQFKESVKLHRQRYFLPGQSSALLAEQLLRAEAMAESYTTGINIQHVLLNQLKKLVTEGYEVYEQTVRVLPCSTRSVNDKLKMLLFTLSKAEGELLKGKLNSTHTISLIFYQFEDCRRLLKEAAFASLFETAQSWLTEIKGFEDVFERAVIALQLDTDKSEISVFKQMHECAASLTSLKESLINEPNFEKLMLEHSQKLSSLNTLAQKHFAGELGKVINGFITKLVEQIKKQLPITDYRKINGSLLLSASHILADEYGPNAFIQHFGDHFAKLKQAIAEALQCSEDIASLLQAVNVFLTWEMLSTVLVETCFADNAYLSFFQQLMILSREPEKMQVMTYGDLTTIIENLVILNAKTDKTLQQYQQTLSMMPLTATPVRSPKNDPEKIVTKVSMLFDPERKFAAKLEVPFIAVKQWQATYASLFTTLYKELRLLDGFQHLRESTAGAIHQYYRQFCHQVSAYLQRKVKQSECGYHALRNSQQKFFDNFPLIEGREEEKIFAYELGVKKELQAIEEKRCTALVAFPKPYKHVSVYWQAQIVYYQANIEATKAYESVVQMYGEEKSLLSIFFNALLRPTQEEIGYTLNVNFEEKNHQLFALRKRAIERYQTLLNEKRHKLKAKIDLAKSRLPLALCSASLDCVNDDLAQDDYIALAASTTMTGVEIERAYLKQVGMYAHLEGRINTTIIKVKRRLNELLNEIISTIQRLPTIPVVFYEHNTYHLSLIRNKSTELARLAIAVGCEQEQLISGEKIISEDSSLEKGYEEQYQMLTLFQGNNQRLYENFQHPLYQLIDQALLQLRQAINEIQLYAGSCQDRRCRMLRRLHDALLREQLTFVASEDPTAAKQCKDNCHEIIEERLFSKQRLETLSEDRPGNLLQQLFQWLRIHFLKPLFLLFNRTYSQPLWGASRLERLVFFAAAPLKVDPALTLDKTFPRVAC